MKNSPKPPVNESIARAPAPGRRVKMLMINPADFMVLFTKGLKVRGGWKIVKGLPADAQILTIAYDHMRNGIMIVVESAEFELIAATELPPILKVEIEINNNHVKKPRK